MSQTEYTGRLMEVVIGAVTLEGLTRVELSENDGPDAEQLDVTVYGDSTYTYLTDPLGAKGDDKTTLTATCWASTASYADNKASKIALNTAATTVFDTAKGTANANTYTHTSLEMTRRVTEIPYDAYATVTVTQEANALGAWTAPA